MRNVLAALATLIAPSCPGDWRPAPPTTANAYTVTVGPRDPVTIVRSREYRTIMRVIHPPGRYVWVCDTNARPSVGALHGAQASGG